MGKPTGFLEYTRREDGRRPAAERVRDWEEFHLPLPEEKMCIRDRSRPDSSLPALLDIPIVKSGTEESLTPVGTGPYYFTTDEAGACLASHSGWWRGESRPAERIALSAARDREAILYQFSSHEVQLITADLIGTEPITATGNISYEDADTTVLQFLGFNTARAPFQDSAARRALGLGINRETLVSAVLSGHARAAQFPVSPVSPLYPAELESLYLSLIHI